MKSTVRESSFELLRLISQFMIIYYHIFVFIYFDSGESVHQAIWLPMHIGVPIFILISGYWGIKTNIKSLVKIIGKTMVYTLPIVLIFNMLHSGGGNSYETLKAVAKSVLFISNTPFWFIRTYICLMLAAPLVNCYLNNIDDKYRKYTLISFSFVCIYLGTLSQCDSALNDGKNLANFIFLYIVGNSIRYWYPQIRQRIGFKMLLIGYLLFNPQIRNRPHKMTQRSKR